MKKFIFIMFSFLISSSFCFSQNDTHEEFARHVVHSLYNDGQISDNAKIEEIFEILRQKGIEPAGGFQKGKILDVEESVQLFGKLISEQKETKIKTIKAVASEYINRITFLKINGKVLVDSKGNNKWKKAKVNMQIKEGAIIKTKNNSEALLQIGTIGNVFLKENCVLDLAKMRLLKDGINENVHLHLAKGKMIVNVQGMSKKSNFQTSIPSALVAVRGTIYEICAE